MEEKRILIVCGEPSGDLNAANLASEIIKIAPQTRIFAVGGKLLKAAGAEIICDIKELSVMGFFDIISKLPRFFALKKLILDRLKLDKFDLVILVDFSGFNLRLAKAINKKCPVFYYICPQIWASRSGRIKTIKEYIDKMIVVFKFEEELYKKYGMDVNFFGHPLLDIVKPDMSRIDFLRSQGLSGDKPTLALLPGSRIQEISLILPVMLQTCVLLKKKYPDLQILIAKVGQLDYNIYDRHIRKHNLKASLVEGKAYNCVEAADFCLICSGTATLETAILQKPFCVIYKMSPLNYCLIRPMIKIPYISIANIVANKPIVPEFIQFRARPGLIADEVYRLMQDPQELSRMKMELLKVKASLGENGAGKRAAGAIMEYLNK